MTFIEGGIMGAGRRAKPVEPGRYISVAAARKLLGYSEDTIYRRLEAGKIAGYRLSERGWWRISYESVMKYLKMHLESQ